MNVKDAAYATVHDYPGGAPALGPRVNINPVVLTSKVNNAPTHHLTLDEAQRIMCLTGDHRIVRAQLDELGYLPPIPRITAEVSDVSLLEAYTRLMSELGEFSKEFHAALSDGTLTVKEVDAMRSQMMDFFSAGEELLSRAREIAER